MMKISKFLPFVLLSALVVACTNQNSDAVVKPSIEKMAQALAGDHRSEKYQARDKYRNPAETLAFLQVEPQHAVVEIWPGGGGWYTEILAPYLRGSGQFYAAHFHPDAAVPFFWKSHAKYQAKLAARPDIYSDVVTTVMQPGLEINMAPAGSVDRVLTFRNVHNWMKAGFTQEVFDAAYTTLKPGGLFGVVEHRAAPDTSFEDMSRSGYVTEAQVRVYAENAGFEFVGASEINANPDDTKQHPAGVWSLPPTLRLKDENRAYYVSIGESDRMTLLFRKAE